MADDVTPPGDPIPEEHVRSQSDADLEWFVRTGNAVHESDVVPVWTHLDAERRFRFHVRVLLSLCVIGIMLGAAFAYLAWAQTRANGRKLDERALVPQRSGG